MNEPVSMDEFRDLGEKLNVIVRSQFSNAISSIEKIVGRQNAKGRAVIYLLDQARDWAEVGLVDKPKEYYDDYIKDEKDRANKSSIE